MAGFALAAARFVGADLGTARLMTGRGDFRVQPPDPHRGAPRAWRRRGIDRDQVVETAAALLVLEFVDRHAPGPILRRGCLFSGAEIGEWISRAFRTAGPQWALRSVGETGCSDVRDVEAGSARFGWPRIRHARV